MRLFLLLFLGASLCIAQPSPEEEPTPDQDTRIDTEVQKSDDQKPPDDTLAQVGDDKKKKKKAEDNPDISQISSNPRQFPVYNENGEYIGDLPIYNYLSMDNDKPIVSYHDDQGNKIYSYNYGTQEVLDPNGNVLHQFRESASSFTLPDGNSNIQGRIVDHYSGIVSQFDSKGNITDSYIIPSSELTSKFSGQNAYVVRNSLFDRWMIYDKNWKYVTDLPAYMK